MKQAKIRPGVVLISICDEHILVATREARGAVPYVQQINGPAAFYWKMLEEGKEPKEIVQLAAEKYHMPGGKAVIAVASFMKKLQQSGYLLAEDVEDAK